MRDSGPPASHDASRVSDPGKLGVIEILTYYQFLKELQRIMECCLLVALFLSNHRFQICS